MAISQEFLEKEDLRVRLFADTWRTLIPEVFRDVPPYYDKGNAVASLGNCSRWSNTFAAAIRRHVPPGSKVLDVCSGLHDIPLRLLASDPTLEIHAVDGSPHMTEAGQSRARERNLTIRAQVCDAHTLPFPDASFDAVTLQFASRHLEMSGRSRKSIAFSSRAEHSATTTCFALRRGSSSCRISSICAFRCGSRPNCSAVPPRA